ncbi:MAG: hypothetical protein KKG33_07315 [candidate division Zixibacteria bacterium]|nr:hypothetical protein [candidate division Zixibacteria bacterium]MBU1471481.1 hypothetical protein [candidate division Zixibacteria bacterium]MBU2625353.1 hypothetical protein [candidate division Zixibacteria bacterium]
MKINPNLIQAYRNIPDPGRVAAQQQGNSGKSVGRASRGKASVEITGSDFLSMLSKAEKQFLSDKFSTTTTRKADSDSRVSSQRGRLLDIRV